MLTSSQTMNQLLEKMKQGHHAFDVNAEPEPEDLDCPDIDADYEEDLGDCEDRGEEHKEGCEASGSRTGRYVCWMGRALRRAGGC